MNKFMKMLFMALFIASMCACSSGEATMPSAQVENSLVQFSFFQSKMEKFDAPSAEAKSARALVMTRGDDDAGSGNANNLKSSFKRLDITILPIGQASDKAYVFHQKSSDDDFGKLNLRLPIGDYRMIAVASNAASEVEIASATLVTFPDILPTDMAYIYKELSVKSGTNSVNCAMQRSVSKLSLVSTDTITKDISKIEMVYVGKISKSFNPTTGFCVMGEEEASTITRVWNITDTNRPKNTIMLNSFFFLASEELTIQADVKVYNSKGDVVKALHFDDVALKNNHITTYTGPLFTSGTSLEFVFTNNKFLSSGSDKKFDDEGNFK